jgi:cytochrome b561
MPFLERARRLVPALWAGWLLCVALLATPAAFATLERAVAGRTAGRMLAQEAYTSLALAVGLLILQRLAARHAAGQPARPTSPLGTDVLLTAGALFCTVAGYFAVQPMMAAAREGQGPLSFGQLHAVSTVFYLVKVVLVLALAWRCTRGSPSGPATA